MNMNINIQVYVYKDQAGPRRGVQPAEEVRLNIFYLFIYISLHKCVSHIYLNQYRHS